MNFTSLPDEMIANCLKFLDCEEVTKLRKINRRISNIAKRHKYGQRIPVENLHLNVWHTKLNMKAKWPVVLYSKMCALNKFSALPPQEFLKKIEITDQISINNFLHLEGFFENEYLEQLEEHRRAFRFVKRLEMEGLFLENSLEELDKFMNLLPSLSCLCVHELQFVNAISKCMSIHNRKWNSLSFRNCTSQILHDHEGLNNAFLMDVAKNCNSLNVELDCGAGTEFTIGGVLQFLERYVLKTDTAEKRQFNLTYVKLNGMSLVDVKKRLVAIEGFDVKFTPKAAVGKAKITHFSHCEIFCPSSSIQQPIVSLKIFERWEKIS